MYGVILSERKSRSYSILFSEFNLCYLSNFFQRLILILEAENRCYVSFTRECVLYSMRRNEGVGFTV